jgi:hypothetical protein
MRLAQTLQSRLDDAVGEAKEPGLHIFRKRRDFGGDVSFRISTRQGIPLYISFLR